MGKWSTFFSLQMSLLIIKLNYYIRIINSILYEFKISLQLVKTFRIVIDIVKDDRRWKCCHDIKMTWLNQMVCVSF
jgi:hypothetical protein